MIEQLRNYFRTWNSKHVILCAVVCVLLPLDLCKSDSVTDILSTLAVISTNAEGCFVAKDACPNSNISYYLYTRDTQDSPHLIDPTDIDTIANAPFVEGAPLKVIVHGYTGHKDFAPNIELRPAYFEEGEYNIISVDWGALATPCYATSAQNVYVVAKCAAEFLDVLFESRAELDVSNTHILGFSLGAHVVGNMGRYIQTGKVSRITAFDPALPLFGDETVYTDAASFVDVYHSNAGFEGKTSACGHVDIYFNDGLSQPGCNCYSSCDHKRSVEYFTESISSSMGLWGFACDSWDSYLDDSCSITSTDNLISFGHSISTNMPHGVYFAVTNSESPFFIEPPMYVNDSELAYKVDGDCAVLEYIKNKFI